MRAWFKRILCGVLLGVPACQDQGAVTDHRPADAGPAPEADEDVRYQSERSTMVSQQISHPVDGRRPVTSSRVLAAMQSVPRHAFVPETMQAHAYRDRPLPIGEGQTISQPYIVALMTELLEIQEGDRILEIGTGSGYQAAVLGELTNEVYSIELLPPLAEAAAKSLRTQGYDSIQLRTGDGFKGWPEAAPFDHIILTCAIDEIPPPLWSQLQPGGRLVMPLGPRGGMQHLIVSTKQADGTPQTETITAVRFVPLVRE
ncbi:MAG: protein-L-isoaspartate(D-aspartate) O-methyltransferase [Planctomycetota bacterium]|nr:protein-L-isoaspartate(D-aspartate) O-methyltransferase [Planctomycetota bacterium]